MRAEAGVRPVRREDSARTRGGRTRLVRSGKIALGLLAVLVVLAVVAGIAFAGSADRVAAGVAVDGVSVGGLTAEEAQAKLERVAARYASQPVVFTAAEQEFRLRPTALEVQADWAAAAAEAMERGDAPFPVRGLERIWLRLFGAEVAPSVDAFQAALDERLERIAARVDRPAVEASLVLDGLEPEIVPGQAGRRLDRDAAAAVMVATLAGFDREETPLPVVVDAPEVTSHRLEPVAAQLRTVLSAPVQLTHRGAVFTFQPSEMVRLIELPANGVSSLRIRQDVAAHRFENLARGLARAPRNADFAVRANKEVRVIPSRPGRELNVAATAAALQDADLERLMQDEAIRAALQGTALRAQPPHRPIR